MDAQTSDMSLPRPDWDLPVKVHLGEGLLEQYLPNGPVVLLADPNAVELAMREQLVDRFKRHGVSWVWQVHQECELNQLVQLSRPIWQALDSGQSVRLMAIGGGTTLDIAKVLRWRPRKPMTDSEVLNVWRSQGQCLTSDWVRHSLACWPSTAGTGSEVSASATLWDKSSDKPQKLSWQPQYGHADEAWVDSVLTHSCPAKVTRDCALDALAHALESLWNVRANPLTRLFAHSAVQLIMANLPIALTNVHDRPARTALSKAALLAGMAMSQTQTALAHALSYDLTLKEGIPHGEAVAIWLPMVTRLACQVDPSLNVELQKHFGTQSDPAAHLQNWLQALGVSPRTMEDLPDGQADVDRALQSPRGLNQFRRSKHGI